MTRPCEKPIPVGKGRWTERADECIRPRMKGRRACVWHWLMKQPADMQASHAKSRRTLGLGALDGAERARVPESEWPPGERWCAGCQSMVPLFYCSGSRCKAHASMATHAARVEKVYGITGEEYDALLRQQGGRCFICQRPPGTKRLAVDHDHVTGAVRGLLCASNEFGCNRAILGNIKDLDMAHRILLYLAQTPYDQLKAGSRRMTWEEYVRGEADRIARERTLPPSAARQASVGTPGQVPPF